MKRYAFTLMELIVGLMILAVTSAVVIVNVNAVKGQSAKREAEKLAQWLMTRMTIADSRNEDFTLSVIENVPVAEWASSTPLVLNRDKFEASKGCTFELTEAKKYHTATNNFAKGGTIKVFGKEGLTAPYYVIIATIGGRVRVDDKPPQP